MAIDLATKLAAITDYYGVGTIWDKMSITGLSAEQINAMYNALPASSFQVDRTASGVILGRNYTNPFELPVVPGSDFDSNIPGGQYSGGNTFTGNIPANLVVDPSTGLPVSQSAGPTTAAGSIIPAVADRISLAVAGVNIGARLGLSIDSLLYSSDPAWWDTHLPTVNPETWSNLVGQSAVGDFFLRTLFGISNDNMTGYISADALAYYYQMLRDAGAWDEGVPGIFPDYDALAGRLTYTWSNINMNMPQYGYYRSSFTYAERIRLYTFTGDSSVIWLSACNSATDNNVVLIAFSKTYNATATLNIYFPNSGTTSTYDYHCTSGITGTSWYYFVYTGNTYVSYINSLSDLPSSSAGMNFILGSSETLMKVNSATNVNTVYKDMATILDNSTIGTLPVIPGISELPSSTPYPPTNITGTTPQQVKTQLQQEYPELFTDIVTERTMQEDGTIRDEDYIPIPWVIEGLNPDEPTTGEGKGQTDEEVDPITGEQILPTSEVDEPTQPPDTGTGDAPVPVLPTGSASSLWAIYNPTQAELNSFGAWLWSSNFIEQLKKLFNDPMQAIIGVHKVFATPSTGSSQTIKCGYIDSGVSAKTVTSQYTTVDCGKAVVREYFGNVFDYDPFTKISLFLPFIGIVPLNTADVMRGKVSVKYSIDVISGACLAEVTITRDSSGGILYTYSGSAIVSYPLSSGSYMGVVQSALTTAIGIGMGIASGGASAGLMAGSVLSGVTSARTNVQHSGQFSGCSGAMGGKKPYLIITRPQTRTPTNINKYTGLPAYAEGKLSEFSGYTKVKEVHVESQSAYSGEIEEITALLKSGVII